MLKRIKYKRDYMNKEEYLKIVKKHTPKENNKKDYICSFLSGGLIGLTGEAIKLLLVCVFNLTSDVAISWVLLIAIFTSCLLTCLGKFDDIINILKSGIIIPITGFAHSISSVSLDYKHDGLITGIGSNFFKLAGSVLLYAITSGFIMGIIKVIINV